MDSSDASFSASNSEGETTTPTLDDIAYMAKLVGDRVVDVLTYRPDTVGNQPHQYLIGPEDLDATVWSVLYLKKMINDMQRPAA
jgi:hypothetical protein